MRTLRNAIFAALIVLAPEVASAQDMITPDVSIFEAKISGSTNKGNIFAGGDGAPLTATLSIKNYMGYELAGGGPEFAYQTTFQTEFLWTLTLSGQHTIGGGPRTVEFFGSSINANPTARTLSFRARGQTVVGGGPRPGGTKQVRIHLHFSGAPPTATVSPRNVFPVNFAHYKAASIHIVVFQDENGLDQTDELTAIVHTQTRPVVEQPGCDLTGIETALDDVQDSLASIGATFGEFGPGESIEQRLNQLSNALNALNAKMDALKADTEAIKAALGVE